ncbi:MAG: UDP-N-acetylmuramoyl-L-alanine--D-glutamate ligase [Legionellales bacterium RIFCSPHIGHO2_12_FULL_42_9]|nr:MAG: UDP-N-acetylmuramoyl-L-alanine--D-glutamate ligase [Legionellales bacterium RIFCSPHIGHO2_12_FULL_42_9]
MSEKLVLVAGLGKTGYSIAHYLKRKNQPFIAFDTRSEVLGLDEFKTTFPGVDLFLHDLPQTIYPTLTAVIMSPGISLDEPFLQCAREQAIPIYGDIECFAQEVQKPVIAITGTNGKSTVTTLVGEMVKKAGFKVAVAGNIGDPVLDRLNDDANYDFWVLELSSFQLDLTHSLAPKAAALLNVTPDHLDRHHTMAAYVAAKQRVYQGANALIYNRQDPHTLPQKGAFDARVVSYGLDEGAHGNWGILEKDRVLYLAQGQECVLPVEQLRIKGKHNWQNALAACALAGAAGVAREAMVAVLTEFPGLAHRCQWVRTLDSVEWINDSKGTNVGATESAIAGIGGFMQGKIVLIAGGLGKGADFAGLRQPVLDYVRLLVLIGQDADKIASDLTDTVPIVRASTIEEAVGQARVYAKPGDVVLLSPACASFDMFRDFNHRGEVFTQLVSAL